MNTNDSTPRILIDPPSVADVLDADLRSLQDMANRRGGAWLIKWASMFQGIGPGDIERDMKSGGGDMGHGFPFEPDPRD